MTFDATAVRTYNAQDVPWWFGTEDDDGAYVGYIADQAEGSPMGLAFVHFRKGVNFDFAWPYDELSIVTKGSLTVHSQGERITTRAGEFMNMPIGVPGSFEIEEDMEMVCVHYPTFEQAMGMSPAANKARLDAGREEPEPELSPRGRQWAGGFFDPTVMQNFGAQDVPSWITVDEDQGAYVGYIADEAEGSPMGLAFSHFRAGGVFEFTWPYDEVGVVTKGSVTVRSGGETSTARAGEFIYMPKGVSAVFEIDEDIEVVGVHYPTFEQAEGYPPHAA